MHNYEHNPAAFRAFCRMTARWKDQTVTGIIGVPGDRDNLIVRQAGRIAANGFDRIIIKQNCDPRGQTRGGTANLLCRTIAEESPHICCDIVRNEIKASARESRSIGENRVVVIFYDKLLPILDLLAQHNAVPVAALDNIAPVARTAERALTAELLLTI